MDLDLRNRLDPYGKRQGKVVDYTMSELRAMELTEGLCTNMKDYQAVEMSRGDEKRRVYQKLNNADGPVTISGSMQLGGANSEGESRELRLYCDRLVEEHEEDIASALQKLEVRAACASGAAAPHCRCCRWARPAASGRLTAISHSPLRAPLCV